MTETVLLSPRTSPSSSLIANLRVELMRALPFAQMLTDHVDRFVAGSTQAYFAPGEVVMEPASGPAEALLCIRQGSVSGRKGWAASAAGSSTARRRTC